jgi:hypothetical protein
VYVGGGSVAAFAEELRYALDPDRDEA